MKIASSKAGYFFNFLKNMKFRFLQGKNNKDFVQISDVQTQKDMQLYEIIEKTLTRSEYNPFIKSFNKTIQCSYLLREYIFPLQFWEDIKKQLLNFPDLIKKEDIFIEGFINDKQIEKTKFDEWIHSIKIPEDLSIDKEEYMYQQESVFKALNNRTARIEVATSGGKTFITYLYCKYIIEHKDIFKNEENKNKRILIIVPSKTLCLQLINDFADYDSLNDRKITVETIFSGSKRLYDADVVCGTYQSLREYEEDYFDDFSVMICDELHGAKAFSIRNQIYNKLKYCEFIFGMTGTFPKYNSLDYIHIVSMFGPEIVNVSAMELIQSGVANPVKIKSIEINYFKDSVSSENAIKNIRELIPEDVFGTDKYIAEKYYFQHNEKRTNIISKFLNTFNDNSIILVDTVEYCDLLYNQLTKECPNKTFAIIHGKIKDREDIIHEMKTSTENYVIIATFGTMSTGVSIKNLTNVYLVDCGKSDKRIRQSIGRAMRITEGKNNSMIIDFQDNIKNSTFYKHSRERLSTYKEQKFPISYHKTNICI